jgi:hypothetical protein
MGHPLVDEFCRAKTPDLRPDFFRRCQRVFRDEVNPVYDEAIRLREENADLKAKLEALQSKAQRRKAEAEVSA